MVQTFKSRQEYFLESIRKAKRRIFDILSRRCNLIYLSSISLETLFYQPYWIIAKSKYPCTDLSMHLFQKAITEGNIHKHS
jgi:hypothetical protein